MQRLLLTIFRMLIISLLQMITEIAKRENSYYFRVTGQYGIKITYNFCDIYKVTLPGDKKKILLVYDIMAIGKPKVKFCSVFRVHLF